MNDLVERLGLIQVREDGRRRLYRLNGRPLRAIYEWVRAYEQTWSRRLDLLDDVVAELKEREQKDVGNDE